MRKEKELQSPPVQESVVLDGHLFQFFNRHCTHKARHNHSRWLGFGRWHTSLIVHVVVYVVAFHSLYYER